MAQKYEYLSYYGTHYMMKDYTDSDSIPSQVTVDDEIQGVYNCTLGEITKEVTTKRTLNGDGWEAVAVLGNTQNEGTFELIRLGTGDPYLGVAGDSTYTKIKDWFMKSTANGGSASRKTIVELIPRDIFDLSKGFEGTIYNVLPVTWEPGTRDTESGQEYSFSVKPFGPPIPVKVTHNSDDGTESWSLEKVGA